MENGSELIVQTIVLVVTIFLVFALLPFSGLPDGLSGSTNLQVFVNTDKVAYGIDENINLTVIISNNGSENVTLQFASSCQVSFRVEDSYGVVWYDDSRHLRCLEVFTSLTLGPGQIHEYHFLWDQLDDNGVHVFSPRDYTLRGSVLIPMV